MRQDWISAWDVLEAVDWRPAYFFSPAMQLARIGKDWPTLGEQAECLDGWRVSTNPASRAYDERVETAPIYRMRHVGDMQLLTDAVQWQSPEVKGQPYCVQPHDLVVRKVGKAGAALVNELHRRHPVDANLAIVRGLQPVQAVWVAYCLNQPLYRAFLESADTITSLVRVNLKQLAALPIAPMPEGFMLVAKRYLAALTGVGLAQDQLFHLRGEVKHWLQETFFDHLQALPLRISGRRCQRFSTEDIEDVLNINAMEQRHRARSLTAERLAVSLGELAQISPRYPQVKHPLGCQVLRITDVDEHFGIAPTLVEREAISWRTQKRAITRYDVLISSFVSEARVAFVAEPVEDCILPTEQLITLCFHRHQGAYALLMESALVQAQWMRLATGSLQRFVQYSVVKELVLPLLPENLAEDWHERLLDLLHKQAEAQQAMRRVRGEIQHYYRTVHPVSEEDTHIGGKEVLGWQPH